MCSGANSPNAVAINPRQQKSRAAIVRANGNGYTTCENNSHKYFVRLYAKAKGSGRVYRVGVSGNGTGPFQPGPRHYTDKAGKSEGWTTCSRSVGMNVAFADTRRQAIHYPINVVCRAAL